jgi:hypothetical protein
MNELTIEQSLMVRNLEIQIARLNKEQLAQFTLDLYRQLFIQENAVRNLMMQQWGM